MLRPAQIVGAGTRLHPPAFGGNKQHKRKSVFSQVRRAPVHQFTLWLERLDHRQQHDEDHQNCRYLIDNTIVFLAMPVVVGGELLDENSQMAMQAGQYEHQRQLGVKPRRCQPAAAPGQPRPEQPGPRSSPG